MEIVEHQLAAVCAHDQYSMVTGTALDNCVEQLIRRPSVCQQRLFLGDHVVLAVANLPRKGPVIGDTVRFKIGCGADALVQLGVQSLKSRQTTWAEMYWR